MFTHKKKYAYEQHILALALLAVFTGESVRLAMLANVFTWSVALALALGFMAGAYLTWLNQPWTQNDKTHEPGLMLFITTCLCAVPVAIYVALVEPGHSMADVVFGSLFISCIGISVLSVTAYHGWGFASLVLTRFKIDKGR